MFTVQFAGGTVHDYVTTVASMVGFENLVIDDVAALKALKAPPVTLNHVTLFTALELVTVFPYRDQRGLVAPVFLRWIGPAAAKDGHGPVLGSVCVVSSQPLGPSRDAPIRAAAFDLSRGIGSDGTEIEELVDLIKTSIEFSFEPSSFKATYHEPSMMLLAKGTEEELALVRAIVGLRVGAVASTLHDPTGAMHATHDEQTSPTAVTYATTVIGEGRAATSVDGGRPSDASPPNGPFTGSATRTVPPASSGQRADLPTEQTTELQTRPIPEPITDQELATMSAYELKERLAQISTARQRSGLDRATKDRLKNDFDRVLQRLKQR